MVGRIEQQQRVRTHGCRLGEDRLPRGGTLAKVSLGEPRVQPVRMKQQRALVARAPTQWCRCGLPRACGRGLRFTLPLDARAATGDTVSITEIRMKRAAAAPAPAVAPRASSQLSAAPRKGASELSVRSSQYSLRTPSTIRTDDPSAIARNKIAELELRLELERVVRLERENELEAQRRQTLEAESKLASQTKAKAAASAGAPGKADQLALLG